LSRPSLEASGHTESLREATGQTLPLRQAPPVGVPASRSNAPLSREEPSVDAWNLPTAVSGPHSRTNSVPPAGPEVLVEPVADKAPSAELSRMSRNSSAPAMPDGPIDEPWKNGPRRGVVPMGAAVDHVANGEADGFQVFAGMDTFTGSDVYMMPASDIAACKQLCIERGLGAFVVYNGTAYFRQQSPEQCRAKLVRRSGATTFVVADNDAPPTATRSRAEVRNERNEPRGNYRQAARSHSQGSRDGDERSHTSSLLRETTSSSKVSPSVEKKNARRRKLDPTLHLIASPEARQTTRMPGDAPREACRCNHQ